MDEYIEREAFLADIDAAMEKEGMGYVIGQTMKRYIKRQPAADVVEVVRCKYCKHSQPLDRTKPPYKYYKDSCVLCVCEDVVGDEHMIYLPTHFCSYGERRSE